MLGYQHPKNKKNGINTIMTIDFLVTYKESDGQLKTVARSIKPFKDLYNKRTLEKLIIEKFYCESVGMEWALVTEKEIDRILAVNL